MSAHHFFVEEGAQPGEVVTISGEEAHHAIRVLRLRPGERITVADGSGLLMDAVVTRLQDDVEADIASVRYVDEPRPVITLVQALTKGDRFEWLVEKAVEVGVRHVVPFVAERTVVRWDPKKRERMRQRWLSIARAAAKQSRSPWLTDVGEVHGDVTDLGPLPSPAFVLHEGDDRRLRDQIPQRAPDRTVLLVGPEGGLTDREVEWLVGRGAHGVTLGPRILRAETAGVVGAALLAYAYGSLG